MNKVIANGRMRESCFSSRQNFFSDFPKDYKFDSKYEKNFNDENGNLFATDMLPQESCQQKKRKTFQFPSIFKLSPVSATRDA